MKILCWLLISGRMAAKCTAGKVVTEYFMEGGKGVCNDMDGPDDY